MKKDGRLVSRDDPVGEAVVVAVVVAAAVVDVAVAM